MPVFAALVAMLVVSSAQAALVTQSYANGVISTTSNFAAGTTTAVNLGAQVTLLPGQFFKFGVSLGVAGNPDPAFGTPYADAAFNRDGVVYPANLGFSALNFQIGSSDAAGANLVPLNLAGKARTTFNNTPWPGATTDVGDVTGGVAGSPSPIFKGLPPFDPTSTTSVTGLGALASPGNAGVFISTIVYQAPAGASDSLITLSPQIIATATGLWKQTQAGQDDGSGGVAQDANFLNGGFLDIGGADSISLPAFNNGTILVHVAVPEPASMCLLSIGLFGLLGRRRMA
jgi:hypothetical protein